MKYTLDDNYFDIIDSAEKAYWLGFLYADGHVALKAPWFVICQIKDIDHLNKFKTEIKFTGPIKIILNAGGFANSCKMGRLVLCRKTLCKSLSTIGCSGKKDSLPSCPSKYLPSFIRGLFDGDGTVSKQEKYCKVENKTYGPYIRKECNIIVHEQVVESLKNILEPIIGKVTVSDSKTSYMKYIRWSSKKAIDQFVDFIYSQPGSFLERKKDIFKS